MHLSDRLCFWLGLALGLTVLAVALFGDQGFREVRRLRAEGRRLAGQVAELEARRDALEAQIRDLTNNPRAIEERARRDLGMIRKGETLFLLPERHDSRR
ncbi:MAG: hypothetical protein Kow0092_39240 [Deferrisomatales bacterium]